MVNLWWKKKKSFYTGFVRQRVSLKMFVKTSADAFPFHFFLLLALFHFFFFSFFSRARTLSCLFKKTWAKWVHCTSKDVRRFPHATNQILPKPQSFYFSWKKKILWLVTQVFKWNVLCNAMNQRIVLTLSGFTNLFLRTSFLKGKKKNKRVNKTKKMTYTQLQTLSCLTWLFKESRFEWQSSPKFS